MVNFTKQGWEKLQSIVLNGLLPKLGLNRHFPRVVTFSPARYGGLVVIPAYTMQGYEPLRLESIHRRRRTPLSNLIKYMQRSFT